MHMGRKNPWSDLVKILHWGRYPGRNYRCKFVGRSVKPFFRGEGSNFRLFHRLSQSSLQHSRTTVRVCDKLQFLHLYLQFYYCRTYLKLKKAGHVNLLALDGVFLTKKKSD